MKKYFVMLFLVFALTFFAACNNESLSESDEESFEISADESTSEESKTMVTSSEVYQMLNELLEKEKELVRLFFENGMYELSEKNGNVSPVKKDSEYSSMENVEKLFEIYTFPEKVMPYFFEFPKYGEKAVFEMNGEVYATNYATKKLTYPSESLFYISELGLESATLSFDVGETKKIVLDFETKTISDSPYRMIYSEDYSDKWSAPNFSPTVKNVGSAKSLFGKTLVINVFMNDKKSEWESSDVKKTLNSVNESIKWIQEKADQYGAPLTLTSTTESTSLYYRASSTVTTEAKDQIWINELFTHTTYESLDNYIKTNCEIEKYDNYVVLFHINKEGENDVGRYDTSMFEKNLYKVERAVMYSNSTKKDYITSILRLFGADSLDKAGSEATRYFTNEIMFNSTTINAETTIGEVTAYLIGWTKTVYPQLASVVTKIFNK